MYVICYNNSGKARTCEFDYAFFQVIMPEGKKARTDGFVLFETSTVLKFI